MASIPDNWMKFSGLKAEDVPVVIEPAYPPPAERYRALELLAPDEVKVVILGQDPYHGAGEAHGLAFSVPAGVKMPPSLRNVFQELADDLHIPSPVDTDLTRWVRQGVLLLNTSLSVAPDSPASHANIGWQKVTDAIVYALAHSGRPRVFVLWGKHAQGKKKLIPLDKQHLLIESAHPSPLSVYRGFWHSRPFSKINEWLQKRGEREIDWR